MSYDWVAALYDPLIRPLETRYLVPWRQELMRHVRGTVLEVGIGTGANLGLYPSNIELTGIEPSSGMLERARLKAERLGLSVDLRQEGVERLDLPSDRFDTVVSTLVFCAVRDPLAGLTEVRRVLKPGGTLVMLEHTRSCRYCLNVLLKAVTPATAALFGEHFDRATADTVQEAGLTLVENRLLGLEIFHLIRATK